MFTRPVDADSYQRVFFLELLLRKVVHWELRGHFGSNWYVVIGDYHNSIEGRIKIEKGNDTYEAANSELSYLALSDLVAIIYGKLWTPIFQRVFSNERSLKDSVFRKLIAIRNKLAHFRPISEGDLRTLNEIDNIAALLGRHYQHRNADAYLPGDPEKSQDQIDENEQHLLLEQFKKHNLVAIWGQYQIIEAIRAQGLYPGIGVLDHHLFFELYTKGSMNPQPLMQWFDRNRYDVTFLNVGRSSSYCRMFLPLKIAEKQICKTLNSFTTVVGMSVVENTRTMEQTRADYDFGLREFLGGEGHNMHFSFVF